MTDINFYRRLGMTSLGNGLIAYYAQLGLSEAELVLVIQLEAGDSDLLSKLCLPGAMPCNEAFFQGTGGTYGLGSKTVMANGSF